MEDRGRSVEGQRKAVEGGSSRSEWRYCFETGPSRALPLSYSVTQVGSPSAASVVWKNQKQPSTCATSSTCLHPKGAEGAGRSRRDPKGAGENKREQEGSGIRREQARR